MHVAWFIFHLNTKISSFTDRILQYLHIIKFLINPPLTPCYPVFTYLENQPSCLWWRIPIHSCPWPTDDYPTLYQFSHPFTPNPQIKLQCLHKQHQQHQPSSSGANCMCPPRPPPVIGKILARPSDPSSSPLDSKGEAHPSRILSTECSVLSHPITRCTKGRGSYPAVIRKLRES
jgi:hypothetical protein